MHKTLHLRYDIDRFQESRKEGENEIATIEDPINTTIQKLE